MANIYQISKQDNVASALAELNVATHHILGESIFPTIIVTESILVGHKVALRTIKKNELIVKYGVPIGIASTDISKGQWVHLHNCMSQYDQKSSHLNMLTGTRSVSDPHQQKGE